ncbi:MAG: Hpt domain-containing protein [Bacteroidota bacterium]
MENNESQKSMQNACDFSYLSEMMGGKKNLMLGIMDAFLEQIPEELGSINDAVTNTNYPKIKNVAHTMKSTVSIMGIYSLEPILKEMEALGASIGDIEKIRTLNLELNLICKKAIEEVEKEKLNT